MKNKYHILTAVLLSIIVLFSYIPASAQKFVQDSLVVTLHQPDSSKTVPAVIDSVIDKRPDHPRLIGRYEHNRYLFIPLDLLILTEKPLNETLLESFSDRSSASEDVRYTIAIDEFSVTKKTNSRVSPGYVLNASFQLYGRKKDGAPQYVGQLLYESRTRKPLFRDKMKKGFESVLIKWQDEFISDLHHISESSSQEHLSKLDNFRDYIYLGRNTNLYGSTDIAITGSGWIADNEILFSHREARKKFRRSGYSIRYRHADNYDSIEYGLTNDSWMRRLNRKWLFRAKTQLYFGINKWSDIETAEHKIYDALIGEISLGQSIIFNPLDERSLILGAGLMENIYYIYSRNVNFEIGLSIHVGIKL